MWNPEHLLQSAFESNILLFKTFSWFWTELFWMALKKYFCVTVDSTTLYTVMVPRHHRQYVSTNHQALCFRDISISDSYKLNSGCEWSQFRRKQICTLVCFFKLTPTRTFWFTLFPHSEMTRIFSPETKQTNKRSSWEACFTFCKLMVKMTSIHFISLVN